MRIAPLSVKNFNNYKNIKNNTNFANRPIMSQGQDSVSFGAKIPSGLFNNYQKVSANSLRDLDYKPILEDPESLAWGDSTHHYSKYSDDVIIETLQKLKDDNRFSAKEKSDILLRKYDDIESTALGVRIKRAKENNDEKSFEVAKAILKASPDDETTKEMLLAKDKYNKIPLHYANSKGVKLLLKASPDAETTKKMLLATDEVGIIPAATLDNDSILLFLSAAPDKKTAKEMLLAQQKTSDGNVVCQLAETIKYNRYDHDYSAKLMQILMDVIQDDSTTNKEAIRLIDGYSHLADSRTKYTLWDIKQYLKQQDK